MEYSDARRQEFLAQINADRERMKIQPVEPDLIPNPIRLRLLAVIGLQSLANVERMLPGPRLCDHWGASPSGSLVCEPYARIGDPDLSDKVQIIADGLGIACSIGNPWTSFWFPGKTLRIEFFETPDSKPLEQLRSEAKAAKRQGQCLFGIEYPNN